MPDFFEITTREEFEKFKSEFSKNNWNISKIDEFVDGFEVELKNGQIYSMPIQCGEWIKDQTDEYSNDLIFGADKTRNVVSVEVTEDEVWVYTETPEGVKLETRPFKPWIMSNQRPGGQFTKLKGNLYFNYLKEFATKKEQQAALGKMYQKRIDKFTSYDQEAYMIRSGLTYFKGSELKDVSILSFDIEATGLNPKAPDAKVLLISNTFRKNGEITKKLFAIDEFKSEFEMIHQWCLWVQEMDPSILTGHNLNSYDLHYLHERTMIIKDSQAFVKDYKGGLPLGRDGSIMKINKKPSKFRKDGSQSYDYHRKRIFGREIIDGLFLAIRYDFAREFPSYGLKPIIKHLGWEKEDRIVWDFVNDSPKKLWEDIVESTGLDSIDAFEKWDQFKEYCIDDADDSLKIFDLMAPAQFYWTRSCTKTFQQVTETASGSQLNGMMIRGYLQENHGIPKANEVEHFEGATSIGLAGVYRNVFGVDFASLYPSIIMQYKVYDSFKDPNQNMLKLTEYFTEYRFKHKRIANETGSKYNRDLEQAAKICINSLYGFCGAPGLNFNSPKSAAAITEHGRMLFEEVLVHFTGKDTEYWKEKL